jgi:endonuclease-3
MPRAFTAKEVSDFFARFEAREPDPRSELEYKNPYTLLVAVVLSAQATDKGVNRATAHLFPTVDSPEKMVASAKSAYARRSRRSAYSGPRRRT